MGEMFEQSGDIKGIYFFFLLSIVLCKDTIDTALPIRLNPLACGKFYFSVFIILYPCFRYKSDSTEH